MVFCSSLQKFGNDLEPRFQNFTKDQAYLIDEILNLRNVIYSLPTGGGKTFPFIIPFNFKPRLVLIVSPLISLIDTQYEKFKFRVNIYNLRDEECSHLFFQLIKMQLKNEYSVFLLTTPEKIVSSTVFRTFINSSYIENIGITVVIDEVHLTLTWGLTFRNAYLDLGRFLRTFKEIQLVCCSATIFKTDIVKIEKIYGKEFDIKHILAKPKQGNTISIVKIDDVAGRRVKSVLNKSGVILGIRKLIEQHFHDKNIIIFKDNKKKIEKLHTLFSLQNNSVIFHSSLSMENKIRNLTNWMKNITKIMFATSAISVGVDNKYCSGTIHIGIPKSIRQFVQESGRCGRDNQQSMSIILTDEKSDYFRICNVKIKSLIDVVNQNELLICYGLSNQTRKCIPSTIHYYMHRKDLKSCGECSVCKQTIRSTANFTPKPLILELQSQLEPITTFHKYSLLQYCKILHGGMSTRLIHENKMSISNMYGILSGLTLQQIIIDVTYSILNGELEMVEDITEEGKIHKIFFK